VVGRDREEGYRNLYTVYINNPVLYLFVGEVLVALRVMERMLGKMMSICTVCTQTHLCWNCVEERW
jgi:hypothetical protein